MSRKMDSGPSAAGANGEAGPVDRRNFLKTGAATVGGQPWPAVAATAMAAATAGTR